MIKTIKQIEKLFNPEYFPVPQPVAPPPIPPWELTPDMVLPSEAIQRMYQQLRILEVNADYD